MRAGHDAEARDAVVTLTAVLDWAAVHGADAAEVEVLLDPSVEPALHLAGPGAPVIGEYAALDLALSLGGTSDAGLAYLGKALELRHRLPRLYARVVTLEVSVWKAFRVADKTVDLDHIVAFALGGPTSADNVAMLCRRHHRAKTHGHWTYAMVEPGLFEWTSPTGATSTVDRRRRRP